MLAEFKEGVLPQEEVAWKTSEVSDLLVKVVLVQGTVQGYDPKSLPAYHPGPKAHHGKSGAFATHRKDSLKLPPSRGDLYCN